MTYGIRGTGARSAARAVRTAICTFSMNSAAKTARISTAQSQASAIRCRRTGAVATRYRAANSSACV